MAVISVSAFVRDTHLLSTAVCYCLLFHKYHSTTILNHRSTAPLAYYSPFAME